jgi:hypothetical protein
VSDPTPIKARVGVNLIELRAPAEEQASVRAALFEHLDLLAVHGDAVT